MGLIPITPAELRPGSCPSCARPATDRHCLKCKWLACGECGVVWSGRTGGWYSMASDGLQGNTRRDAEGTEIEGGVEGEVVGHDG